MRITAADIDSVENFVKNELEQRLKERCTQLGTIMQQNEIEFMFGIYASSPTEFKFLPGERQQILAIAEELQKMYAARGKDEFIKNFDVPTDFQIDKSGTNVFSFGCFFGNKPRKLISKTAQSKTEMHLQLLSKLTTFFRSYELEPKQPITTDIVTLVQLENGWRADVYCVFCPLSVDNSEGRKKHCIQCDKTGRWNFSNFKKHMKIHTATKTEKENVAEASKVENSVADISECTLMETPIVLEEFGFYLEDETALTTNDKLYRQFSAQNELLLAATLQNGEHKKFMPLEIDKRCMNINTVDIDADGNCLFSAVIHQLQFVKINSDHHKTQTVALRNQVVSHINNHFDSHKQALKQRLNCKLEEVDELGRKFVSEKLSKNGFWAGTETLIAISNIFEVNILVFEEKGPFYFATCYKSDYNRTIFLAYRRFGTRSNEKKELECNHYDSVCGVDENLLYKCVTDLGTKIDNSVDML